MMGRLYVSVSFHLKLGGYGQLRDDFFHTMIILQERIARSVDHEPDKGGGTSFS